MDAALDYLNRLPAPRIMVRRAPHSGTSGTAEKRLSIIEFFCVSITTTSAFTGGAGGSSSIPTRRPRTARRAKRFKATGHHARDTLTGLLEPPGRVRSRSVTATVVPDRAGFCAVQVRVVMTGGCDCCAAPSSRGHRGAVYPRVDRCIRVPFVDQVQTITYILANRDAGWDNTIIVAARTSKGGGACRDGGHPSVIVLLQDATGRIHDRTNTQDLATGACNTFRQGREEPGRQTIPLRRGRQPQKIERFTQSLWPTSLSHSCEFFSDGGGWGYVFTSAATGPA
jgi:hypothetical protein